MADEFQARWNFPNCLGALDGKHINIRPPMNTGSAFYNYKHRFSIVLMALADASCKFIYVDVGCNGRISDGGVFNGCTLQKVMDNRSNSFPDPKPAPGDERPLGFAIIADDAFPLQETIMKPLSHKDMLVERRIYNYRLSRARRVVENAFGIMANRFRVFLTTIDLAPIKVEKLVLAACVLHNYLRGESVRQRNVEDTEDPVTHNVIPGAWRSDPTLKQVSLPSGTNARLRAIAHREYLVSYFSSVGSVPWQMDKI